MKFSIEGNYDEIMDFVGRALAVPRVDKRKDIKDDLVGNNSASPDTVRGLDRILASAESRKRISCDSVRAAGLPAAKDRDRIVEGQGVFLFKECESFEWGDLPEFRVGKTSYHLSAGKVHICRENYNGATVYAELENIERLFKLQETNHEMFVKVLQEFKMHTYPNKAVIVRGFLREVGSFDRVGCENHFLCVNKEVRDSVSPAPDIQEDRKDIKEDPDWMYKPVLAGVINTRPSAVDGGKVEGTLEVS